MNDLCVCNSEGDLSLISIEPPLTLKSSSRVTSSRINSVSFVPPYRARTSGSTVRRCQPTGTSRSRDDTESLLDIDSTDDEETGSLAMSSDELSVPDDDEHEHEHGHDDGDDAESVSSSSNVRVDNEAQDTREATIWLGTEHGG
jgi:hypothetical protein